jgi:hypothetical protein
MPLSASKSAEHPAIWIPVAVVVVLAVGALLISRYKKRLTPPAGPA